MTDSLWLEPNLLLWLKERHDGHCEIVSELALKALSKIYKHKITFCCDDV